MTPDLACKTCRWWNVPDNQRGYTTSLNECRRNAPTQPLAIVIDTYKRSLSGTWPLTNYDDRCGQWDAVADLAKEKP